jgi:hypothetical protein
LRAVDGAALVDPIFEIFIGVAVSQQDRSDTIYRPEG